MNQLSIASHNHKIQLWISRISECQASNLTVADWCFEHNVSIKTYYYWMRKIKAEAFEALPAERKSKMLSQKPTSPFAEVILPEQASANSCAIKLQVHGVVLEIQNGAAIETIEHTLRAVKSLC